MRRLVLGLVILSGLVSSCGSAASHAAHAPTVAPALTNSAVALAWTPVTAGQLQAAQLAVAEQQYAWCFVYARLDQSLADNETAQCSMAGLTSAEAQNIQDLIEETQ